MGLLAASFRTMLPPVLRHQRRHSGDFSGTPVTGGKVKVSGFNSSLVALHQATPKLGLFAKAGLYAWEAKASLVSAGIVVKF